MQRQLLSDDYVWPDVRRAPRIPSHREPVMGGAKKPAVIVWSLCMLQQTSASAPFLHSFFPVSWFPLFLFRVSRYTILCDYILLGVVGSSLCRPLRLLGFNLAIKQPARSAVRRRRRVTAERQQAATYRHASFAHLLPGRPAHVFHLISSIKGAHACSMTSVTLSPGASVASICSHRSSVAA